MEEKKKTYYVKNKDLLAEIIKYKETFEKDENRQPHTATGKMSNELGLMIMKIADRPSPKTKLLTDTPDSQIWNGEAVRNSFKVFT